MHMTYEELLNKADEEGIELFESDIGKFKGLYIDETITINSNLQSEIEKRCVLAEELGHYYKTHGNILDQSEVVNRKQERAARVWGYEKLVGITKLIEAYKHGVKNRYELSQYLDVTEEYIEEVLEYYKQKHGSYFIIENYTVYFEPLAVVEVYEKLF